jgi:hypothetical protein
VTVVVGNQREGRARQIGAGMIKWGERENYGRINNQTKHWEYVTEQILTKFFEKLQVVFFTIFHFLL